MGTRRIEAINLLTNLEFDQSRHCYVNHVALSRDGCVILDAKRKCDLQLARMKGKGNTKILNDFLGSQQFYQALEFCKSNGLPDDQVTRAIEVAHTNADQSFTQGDYCESIRLFTQLIGIVEPPLVISRFYQPKLLLYLIDYLIEVHKQGFANQKYTQLLFNMFSHTNSGDQLSSFVSYIEDIHLRKKTSRQRQKVDVAVQRFLQNFDVEVAVDILTKNGQNADAIRISQAVGISMHQIDAMIQDQKYIEAAQQIFEHYDEPIGHTMLNKFGPQLLDADNAAAKIIQQTAGIVWTLDRLDNDAAYIKLLWKRPENCLGFLKEVVSERPTALFVDTYISMLIPQNEVSFFGQKALANPRLAVDLMKDPKLPMDPEHLLSVCAEKHFLPGSVALLSKLHRHSEAVTLLMNECAYDLLIDWVLSDAVLTSHDYSHLFCHFVTVDGWKAIETNEKKIKFMQKIAYSAVDAISIAFICEEILNNPDLPVEILQCDIIKSIVQVQNEFAPINAEHNRLVAEMAEVDKEIATLEGQTIGLRPARCGYCDHDLKMPYTVFFCKHAFHNGCLAYDDQRQPYCSICGQARTVVITPKDVDLSNESDFLESALELIRSS